MFYIDDFNREEMKFDEAVRFVNSRNKDQGLLENMKDLEATLTQAQNNYDECDEIDEFYYTWSYEINAFNTVFELIAISGMSKLFGEAA